MLQGLSSHQHPDLLVFPIMEVQEHAGFQRSVPLRCKPDLAQVLHLCEALRSWTKACRLIMCGSQGFSA